MLIVLANEKAYYSLCDSTQLSNPSSSFKWTRGKGGAAGEQHICSNCVLRSIFLVWWATIQLCLLEHAWIGCVYHWVCRISDPLFPYSRSVYETINNCCYVLHFQCRSGFLLTTICVVGWALYAECTVRVPMLSQLNLIFHSSATLSFDFFSYFFSTFLFFIINSSQTCALSHLIRTWIHIFYLEKLTEIILVAVFNILVSCVCVRALNLFVLDSKISLASLQWSKQKIEFSNVK